MTRPAFTLDDFMAQMAQVKQRWPMGRIMHLITGMRELGEQMGMSEAAIEKQLGRMRAIYNSMSRGERAKPEAVDDARRRRVARGAGVEPSEVSQFVKQFEMSRAMLEAVSRLS